MRPVLLSLEVPNIAFAEIFCLVLEVVNWNILSEVCGSSSLYH